MISATSLFHRTTNGLLIKSTFSEGNCCSNSPPLWRDRQCVADRGESSDEAFIEPAAQPSVHRDPRTRHQRFLRGDGRC
jgi:hypothetical protein